MGRSQKRLTSRKEVPILGQAWVAWTEGDMTNNGVATSMVTDAAPTSITANYGYRAPTLNDGSAFPDSWYTHNTGNTTAEQTAVDNQLRAWAAAGIHFFPLLYPRAADNVNGGVNSGADRFNINTRKYINSAMTCGGKFCWMIQDIWWAFDANTPRTWLNEAQYAATLVADMALSNYFKIGTRPVVGIFNNGGTPSWDATHLGAITTAVTNAGFGAPIYIQCNANTTVANALSLDYLTAYGPSGGNLSAGQNSFQALVTKCKTIEALSTTASKAIYLCHCLDNRPRGANPYSDEPTYSELFQFFLDRLSLAATDFERDANHLAVLSNLTETDENGQLGPSAWNILRGVNTPSYGIYLDAMKNARDGTNLTSYDDHYHASWIHADLGSLPAGWSLSQGISGTGGTTGEFQYAEIVNSTTSNVRTLTVALKCNRLRAYGRKGTGRGTERFVVDGGSNNDVNLDDGQALRNNQLLFDSGTLSTATGHTLAVSRVSGTVGFSRVVASIVRP